MADPTAPSPPPDPAGPPTAFLTVMTTTDSEEKAERLARGAIEGRFAACAQISAPVTSVYRWDGAVQTGREWQVLFKTAQTRYPELEGYLLRAHDYDTPEIIATPITHGGSGYLSWIAEETN
ncbi:divalent-cation tolerance protein CutA [Streptomyces sp. NPDC020742]|uniref:divalent-cation tolerance protein CutA n=1 Tax=unclassified Streptomyces TaxID=2593676 RepID=UPI0033E3BF5C